MTRARLNNPRYSRKDYEMVAGIIARHVSQNTDSTSGSTAKLLRYGVLEEQAHAFATVFKADSPYLFDEARFFKACGLTIDNKTPEVQA